MGQTASKKETLPERVRRLLGSPEWQKLSGTELQALRQKLALLDQAGVPPMTVLPATTLRTLQRIPHSSEGHQVPVSTILEHRPVLVFFSHRWLCPEQNKPDDEDNAKAATLVDWVDWYENVYTRTPGSRNVFLWVDYCSMDQSDPLPYIQSLPLFVATCNDFLCYQTADYHERAWCRVEVAVAYAYMTAGRVPWVLCADFRPAEQRKPRCERRAVEDPRTGRLTVEADRPHVDMLMSCAEQSKAWTGGDGRRLRFGDGGATVDAMVLGGQP